MKQHNYRFPKPAGIQHFFDDSLPGIVTKEPAYFCKNHGHGAYDMLFLINQEEDKQ